VIHFAASKAVGESVENPLLYYENNINALVYFAGITTKSSSQFYFLFFGLWSNRNFEY
jgi:UDP-glucose 4-epimerase